MHFRVLWKHLATHEWPLSLSPVLGQPLEAVQLLQVPGGVWLEGWMMQLAAPQGQPELPSAAQPGWLSPAEELLLLPR